MNTKYKWKDDLKYKILVSVLFYLLHHVFAFTQSLLLQHNKGFFLMKNFESYHFMFMCFMYLLIIYSFINKKMQWIIIVYLSILLIIVTYFLFQLETFFNL
jgi:hypothetical protein